MDQPRMLGAAAHSGDAAMLGWLRGFAAFVVIVCHISRATWVSYQQEDTPFTFASMPFFLSLFSLGNLAVALFFALSGCTLYLAQHRQRNDSDLGSFYLRRLARIYPAYLFALLCYLAFRGIFREYYIQPAGHWVEQQFLQELSSSELLMYFSLSANWLMDENHLINNAFWSLPIEFQFYLLFPLLLLAHRKAPWTGIFLVCAAAHLSVAVFDHTKAYTFYWLWQFGAGMLCAHIFLKWRCTIRWWLGLLMMATVYVLVWAAVKWPFPEFPGVDAGTYQGLGAVAIVFIAMHIQTPQTDNWLARFCTWSGTVSYGSYLFHNLFIAIWLLVALRFGVEGWTRFALIGIGTIGCTYLMAQLSYNWLELPWMNLARRVTPSKRAKPAAGAVVSA